MSRERHDPQAGTERRIAARHLLRRPLTCREHDPEVFALIRRHETELDRWFTQRLGYRLHVDGDTARLLKGGYIPEERPLLTHNGRPLTRPEYTILSLILATTVAGPAVISLRDLIEGVRSGAAESELRLTEDSTQRRATVTVLRWMIVNGLAEEMHETVDAYIDDADADAVLRIRPDRISLLPSPALAEAEVTEILLDRAERRGATRQWLRSRIVEDPVVYQTDLTDDEWYELRRRLGEDEPMVYEMFGLVLEARAEGIAAIDEEGGLSEERFPKGGTLGHAALLLIDRIADSGGRVDETKLVATARELSEENSARWSREMVEAPHRLAKAAADLLCGLRLAEWSGGHLCLQPAAARFLAMEGQGTQEPLW